jgi:phytoene dehydrogenase-like protein
MADRRKEKVAVIGAGLGGLSAAISLATEGFSVELFEKNDKVGGKLNVLKAPKRSRAYRNLYFVGGSVNPGAGMPMVVLSGQQVRNMVLEDWNTAS